jgi:hypothetical protein
VRHLPRLYAACGAMRTWIAGVAVAATAVLGLATSAQAIVTSVPTETGTALVGLQPRNGVSWFDGRETPSTTPSTFSNLEGNPVVPASNVYAIYWDPKDEYHGDWQSLIDGFLANLGSASGSFANVLAVDEQYTDKANESAARTTTFRGAFPDTEPYPVLGTCTDPHPMALADRITCLTDHQLQQQLEHFIGTHNLPKGMGTIFYILTPPGVTVCLDAGGATGHCSDSAATPESYENSFCSYHSDISPASPLTGNGETILYAVIPWTAGTFPDGHLRAEDMTTAWDCQDGGFDPASHPIEEREKAKEKTEKEKQELEKATPEERQKAKEAEEREGPHQQEPNQPTSGPGPDGYDDTGLADLIINQIAVEQQNTTTDPLLDGWQDSKHNEATDECRNFFAPAPGGSAAALETTDAGTLFNQTLGGGNYYLNTAFNLAAVKLPYPAVWCLPGIRQEPQFTAPNTVNAGDLVGFDGMESDITLDAGTKYNSSGEEEANYPLFTWDFGDGTPTVTGYAPGGPTLDSPSAFTCNSPWLEPCAAGTFHSYQYGGTYEVTLTATDVGGNTVSVTHPITVDGPAKPTPPPPPPPAPPGAGPSGSGSTSSGSGSPSSSSTAGSSGSGHAPGGSVYPGPVAAATAINHSLPQALNRGVLVGYTVNEQVAGSFQVLLNGQTARKLGVKGPVATGLPAGTPPSLVVGQAILVTTKGGHSAVRIKLSKQTAKHLRHVHTVTLTLRLVVRNATSQNPQVTTVLSTFVLHR